MLELILASSNEHKAKEFLELFNSNDFQITSAKKSLDVIEDEDTFLKNALIKAKAYYDECKKPVLSDDSGLVVFALPNELGVKTARFGGDGLSAKDRSLLLLEKLKNFEGEKRDAYFICVLCFYLSPSEIYFFEGRVEGRIGPVYRGEFGFGYDPIFIPKLLPKDINEDSTLAEIPEWKNKNSHRAIACELAQKFFKERVCQRP